MIIAGEGSVRAELEAQAAALGIGPHEKFTGWIEPQEVFDLMNIAATVLIPSRPEGLPNVAIQAALMARPVVGTRVAGLTEMVVPDQTGLLVGPESSDALAKAIAFLLDHTQTATQMRHAARRRAAHLLVGRNFPMRTLHYIGSWVSE